MVSSVENGEKRISTDLCIYVFEENVKCVIFIIYVDDLILVSKDINMLKSVKTKLKKAFKMTDLGTISNILKYSAKVKPKKSACRSGNR